MLCDHYDKLFFYSDANGKHLLYINLYRYRLEDNIFLDWQTNIQYNHEEHLELQRAFEVITDENISEEQREQLVQKVFEIALRTLPDIQKQFLPDYFLDKNGHFSVALQEFYRQKKKEIEADPLPFIQYDFAFTEHTATVLFRTQIADIEDDISKNSKEITSLDRQQFEKELINDHLKTHYAENFHPENKFFSRQIDDDRVSILVFYLFLHGKIILFFIREVEKLKL